MHIYYVYQYLREDGTPYYIGKGSGRRAYVNQRITPRPDNVDRIQLIANRLSQHEAFLLEAKLIALYGRKDLGTGILRNKTDGGEGSGNVVDKTAWNKGKKQSAEHNQKIATALKNRKKSTEHCQRIKESHSRPCLGKHWWTNGLTECMSFSPPGLDFWTGRLRR